MQLSQETKETTTQLKSQDTDIDLQIKQLTRRLAWKRWGLLGLAITLAMPVTATVGFAYHRYGNPSLLELTLQNEPVEGDRWVGDNVSFEQIDGNQFDVSFTLEQDGISTDLMLQDIDLSLFIPTVPTMAHGNEGLTRWFLTEREFNRQRVIFQPGSPHINLSNDLGGYAPEDLSIGLTNNCLGAGYWELAVYAHTETGTETIYQGYFNFSRQAYAGLVGQMNPGTNYWQQARTMEPWPGFKFLTGLTFDLAALRTVQLEQAVPVQDLKSEPIFAEKEQVSKASMIVYGNDSTDEVRTWEDLRQADLKFHSFLVPGIYDSDRLWNSDFSQLSEVTGATDRQVQSPLKAQSLVEVQLDFANTEGEQRKFVIGGIDLDQVPQLEKEDYSDGVYMPLGFGTPFTQNYADLEANRPEESPFFSVFLDSENQVIDYRQDIGVNGLVMHRDASDDNVLHVYPLSYERMTLIGHYVVDLSELSI